MSRGNIYVGVDLHKEFFEVVMLNGEGRKMSGERYKTVAEEVIDFGCRLTARHHVALEPLDNCFWFIGLLRPYPGSIHLANPYKVRLIAESRLKNDKLDANILADLLRVGYLPEVYIPSDEVLNWRTMIHHRVRLVSDRTRLKNRLIRLIGREGQRVSVTDAFGKKGRMEIDSMELSKPIRDMVNDCLVSIDLLDVQIKSIDKEIDRIGDSDEIVSRLRTIDGISNFSGLAIRAAVGQMERFRSPKAFSGYTGLIPGYRQSGNKRQDGHITKQGVNILRWVLIQAVPHAVRRSPYLKRLYQRICFRSSVGAARVAVAHALARIIYHVWMEARPYYR
jgi:transposase